MNRFEREFLLPEDATEIKKDGKVIGIVSRKDASFDYTPAFRAYSNALKPTKSGVLMSGIYMNGDEV